MILIIDNFDSFTYNLYQLIGSINPDIKVIRNNEMTVDEIENLCPSHIILSPGPGYPKDAGVCIEAVKTLKRSIPILGVCLGHQAICEAYGGTIDHAKKIMHGKQSEILVANTCPLFKKMAGKVKAARYHSLAVKPNTLPENLLVTARTQDDEIMAVMDKDYPVFGVQFHPESILTPEGIQMIKNFLKLRKD